MSKNENIADTIDIILVIGTMLYGIGAMYKKAAQKANLAGLTDIANASDALGNENFRQAETIKDMAAKIVAARAEKQNAADEITSVFAGASGFKMPGPLTGAEKGGN